jgi:hypothetical protein
MVKTLTALTAAGIIAAAAISAPNKAEANPVWLVPAIIAGVGGVAVGTVATANAHPDSYASGNVYVQPHAVATCHIVRERTAGGWRRIEVCD